MPEKSARENVRARDEINYGGMMLRGGEGGQEERKDLILFMHLKKENKIKYIVVPAGRLLYLRRWISTCRRRFHSRLSCQRPDL